MRCCKGLVPSSAATRRLGCSCFSQIGRYKQRRLWRLWAYRTPPFEVDLQLLQQPRLVERIDMQTSDFQRVNIGICGQRGAGKTSFLNQYADHHFDCNRVLSVIPVDFKVANLRVEKERRRDSLQQYSYSCYNKQQTTAATTILTTATT